MLLVEPHQNATGLYVIPHPGCSRIHVEIIQTTRFIPPAAATMPGTPASAAVIQSNQIKSKQQTKVQNNKDKNNTTG